jgi:CubicO group peptidase (beta-lactamase class C family)
MLIVLPGAIRAQETKTVGLTDPKELEAFLDPIFTERMKKLHIPGAAIAIVKDGKIFFAKGYGSADLEKKTPVIANKTIFRIGSITKVFTATSLVQLAERKKINLSDDVNKYLKDFKIQNTYPQPITFGNLLTHTAGFDEINMGRKTTDADKVIPLGEFLQTRLVRRKPPGEFISYSTYGISLAGYLVETISGTSFKDYLNKNIFQPLEMNRTSMGEVPANLQPDLATGYDYSSSVAGGYHPLAFEYFHTFPASDINGTVTDMAHFMLAHVDGGRYGKKRILSERAARDMREQHFTNHPRLLGITYGFFENRQNGVRAIEHGGVMDGFSALMYLSPDKKFGIFVACNREVSGLQETVKARILNRYFPARDKPETNQLQAQLQERLERFAGKYRADIYCHTCKEGAQGYVPQAFEIKANNDGTISFWGAKWKQVEPLVFQLLSGQLDNGEVLVAFRQDQNGQITNMFNGTWTHEKMPPETTQQIVTVNISPQILNAYVGDYEIAPNRFVTITLEGDRLMGVMTGQQKVELSPASETRFVVKEINAEVDFFKDSQGRVTHLILRLNGEEMRGRKTR